MIINIKENSKIINNKLNNNKQKSNHHKEQSQQHFKIKKIHQLINSNINLQAKNASVGWNELRHAYQLYKKRQTLCASDLFNTRDNIYSYMCHCKRCHSLSFFCLFIKTFIYANFYLMLNLQTIQELHIENHLLIFSFSTVESFTSSFEFLLCIL